MGSSPWLSAAPLRRPWMIRVLTCFPQRGEHQHLSLRRKLRVAGPRGIYTESRASSSTQHALCWIRPTPLRFPAPKPRGKRHQEAASSPLPVYIFHISQLGCRRKMLAMCRLQLSLTLKEWTLAATTNSSLPQGSRQAEGRWVPVWWQAWHSSPWVFAVWVSLHPQGVGRMGDGEERHS